VMLREIHHRVYNNLQILISLLNLQANALDDQTSKKVIRASQNRVKAMALVHERLYQTKDFSSIDLGAYADYLARSLYNFYEVHTSQVRLTVSIKEIAVNLDTAIPLGLIINEIISNSLRHAFPSGRIGEIVIDARKDKNIITLIVRDDGIGMPQDFDWRNAKSLGLRLIISLVEQLQGTIELDRSAGTMFTIVVKEKD
jgi:two-component sensor histidine kinase